MKKPRTKPRVCLAASSGGHLTQLMKLEEAWREYDKFYVTTSEALREKLQKRGMVYIICDSNRNQPLKLLRALRDCIRIVLKERPDVTISTGAAPACLLCIVAKFLGARIIWVDSIANIEDLSMSGRIIRPLANLILTQWREVADRYSSVEYLGELL